MCVVIVCDDGCFGLGEIVLVCVCEFVEVCVMWLGCWLRDW